MKPGTFSYVAPDSLAECLALLAEHGDDAKLLAGGQSLVPLMNLRLSVPDVLIDLNRVQDLPGLAMDGSLDVGPLVRQRHIESHPEAGVLAPLLPDAIRHIAHPQIRNRGTIVGSLAHNDPAAELPAVALVLGARFQLVSAAGSREVAAAEFIGSFFSTATRPDEVLARVSFPAMSPGSGQALVELARRPGDFAIAGVACSLVREQATVHELRLATFGVGEGAREYPEVTAPAHGAAARPGLWNDVAEALAAAANPHSDVQASAEFRRHLVRTLAVDAMAKAWSRSGGRSVG